mgnify:CR=1 FL=1
MHLPRVPRSGLVLCLLVLAACGVGCKKPASRPNATQSLFETKQLSAFATPNPEPETPKYVRKEKNDRGTPAEVTEMRQALRNLDQVSSFRATMLIPSSDGTATGELEYVQKQGIHGTLSINGQFISELYKLNGSIYFRHGTSSWENVSDDANSRVIVDGFEQAVRFSNDPSASIRDIARITKTEMDPRGCKAYTFWQYTLSGEEETYRFCLQNGYPVGITKLTSSGNVEIYYRDIDKPISLKTPVVGTR